MGFTEWLAIASLLLLYSFFLVVVPVLVRFYIKEKFSNNGCCDKGEARGEAKAYQSLCDSFKMVVTETPKKTKKSPKKTTDKVDN